MDYQDKNQLPEIPKDTYCDNTECRNRRKHQNLFWVRMSDEIEGGWFIWCDQCIERDREAGKGRCVVEIKE